MNTRIAEFLRAQDCVFGRVCSGTPHDADAPLQALGSSGRKSVFVFDRAYVEDHASETEFDGWEFLRGLGFTEKYIVADVKVYHIPQILVLFSIKESFRNIYPISPASWDGVGQFVRQCYPNVYPDYCRLERDLRNTTVDEFESEVKFSFYNVLKGLDEQHSFVDEEKYLSFATPRTACQLRLFLYCELRLLEFFAGDGLINVPGTAPDAERYCEYLAGNVTLEHLRAIADVVEIVIPIKIPHLHAE